MLLSAGLKIPVSGSWLNLNTGEEAVPFAATNLVALTFPTTCNLLVGDVVPIPIFPVPSKYRSLPFRLTVLFPVRVPSVV